MPCFFRAAATARSPLDVVFFVGMKRLRLNIQSWKRTTLQQKSNIHIDLQ
jgi:hypothetical protein